MRIHADQLLIIASQRRAHLIHVPHFMGADAWLLIETLPGMDREYAREGDGFLLTIEGEHSYWRELANALAALEAHRLTTEAGSTRIRPLVQRCSDCGGVGRHIGQGFDD